MPKKSLSEPTFPEECTHSPAAEECEDVTAPAIEQSGVSDILPMEQGNILSETDDDFHPADDSGADTPGEDILVLDPLSGIARTDNFLVTAETVRDDSETLLAGQMGQENDLSPPLDNVTPGFDETNDSQVAPIPEEKPDGLSPIEEGVPTKVRRSPRKKKAAEKAASQPKNDKETSPVKKPAVDQTSSVLTINPKEVVQFEEDVEDVIWHSIRTSYRAHRILTGTLGALHPMEHIGNIPMATYQGFPVLIPFKEMTVSLAKPPTQRIAHEAWRVDQEKNVTAMMGSEIDFVIRQVSNDTRTIYASRRDAMLRKRQQYYFPQGDASEPLIIPGVIAQARIIGVSEKSLHIEVFGVESIIIGRDLSWDWIGDARKHYHVGERVLVRIQEVQCNGLLDITIRSDIKSVKKKTNLDKLKNCRVQGKYAGQITDISRGTVFIRLFNGANAIAYACHDRRMPGKMDDVSFVVTRIDEEQGIAFGIITRIIKQNL